MSAKQKRREPVPVAEATDWYQWLGSWEKVREVVRRKDGSRFTYEGLRQAVRNHDLRAA